MLLKNICFVLCAFVMIISSVAASNVVHINTNTELPEGFWRKKVIWKPRLVKDWQVRKYVVGVWKKIYSPIELKEWVPFPKPPPSSHSH